MESSWTNSSAQLSSYITKVSLVGNYVIIIFLAKLLFCIYDMILEIYTDQGDREKIITFIIKYHVCMNKYVLSCYFPSYLYLLTSKILAHWDNWLLDFVTAIIIIHFFRYYLKFIYLIQTITSTKIIQIKNWNHLKDCKI